MALVKPGIWARVRGRGWCYVVAWSGDEDRWLVSGLGGLKTTTVDHRDIDATSEARPVEASDEGPDDDRDRYPPGV